MLDMFSRFATKKHIVLATLVRYESIVLKLKIKNKINLV